MIQQHFIWLQVLYVPGPQGIDRGVPGARGRWDSCVLVHGTAKVVGGDKIDMRGQT